MYTLLLQQGAHAHDGGKTARVTSKEEVDLLLGRDISPGPLIKLNSRGGKRWDKRCTNRWLGVDDVRCSEDQPPLGLLGVGRCDSCEGCVHAS